ncbi:unnamed protein product [Oikopleura dioica]|uniref:PH domain-containing protein n=1 Tax=Oikopleura dioica TaxID=34765 RepID=E4XHC7_OIKDI|nr:unnamed protein product [Oikopleura dioica]
MKSPTFQKFLSESVTQAKTLGRQFVEPSVDPATSGIVGRSAPRTVWPCIVSKCWTCGEKSETFFTCDCCGGAQCSKCPLQNAAKLDYENGEKESSKICFSCKEKITAFELIGPATLKKAQALSIYIKHDYIMPYDEMFERAECCGILPVRVNSHHNKLHLISNKFSKRWVALLNYSNDGINSFWAVLIRNSPGDHPRFDVFLSEIRPETEFKQDRSSKEFSYSSPQHRVTFFLESHAEQQIWCDGFRRAYQKASKSRQSRNPTLTNSEFDSENSSGRDSHRNSLII